MMIPKETIQYPWQSFGLRSLSGRRDVAIFDAGNVEPCVPDEEVDLVRYKAYIRGRSPVIQAF